MNSDSDGGHTEMDEGDVEMEEEEEEQVGARALYTSAPTMTALKDTARVPRESKDVRTEYNAPSSFTSMSGIIGHC